MPAPHKRNTQLCLDVGLVFENVVLAQHRKCCASTTRAQHMHNTSATLCFLACCASFWECCASATFFQKSPSFRSISECCASVALVLRRCCVGLMLCCASTTPPIASSQLTSKCAAVRDKQAQNWSKRPKSGDVLKGEQLLQVTVQKQSDCSTERERVREG